MVRVRNLRCPPVLQGELWRRVVEELGDLVVGRIVGPAALLRINERAVARLRALIEDLVEGDAPCRGEAWRGGEPEDDRAFGPDPDDWKQ